MATLSKSTIVLALYVFILYYFLMPSSFGTGGLLDVGESARMKALIHGAVFAVVFILTSGYVVKMATGGA